MKCRREVGCDSAPRMVNINGFGRCHSILRATTNAFAQRVKRTNNEFCRNKYTGRDSNQIHSKCSSNKQLQRHNTDLYFISLTF